jgi:diguanylate cyclase (GGDEF)-like protein
MIDYFLEINRKIENPKIIEAKVFDSIERLVNIDPLTGLYNRRFLDQALKREISLARRNKIPFSIILIDLDFFKTYNDSHGHLAGDDALRLVARYLRETLRAEDLAVRYGGEEFLVILPRATRSGALAIGERLRKGIASLDPNDPALNLRSHITVSGGIATFPQDGNDEKQLLFSVDRALYQAKSEGRNTICICAPDRRRFIRIDFICPIRYQVIRPEATASYAATTRNLGEGGILFAVQQEIPLRAIVRVKISIPESNRTADLIGEVVRTEKGFLPNEPYLVGLSFLQFERGEQNLIVEYIKEKIKIGQT